MELKLFLPGSPGGSKEKKKKGTSSSSSGGSNVIVVVVACVCSIKQNKRCCPDAVFFAYAFLISVSSCTDG